MSLEKATAFLEKTGYKDRIRLFDISTATVPEAAAAIGCGECHIAKTLSFSQKTGCALIVMAGDRKIDNGKYKARFSQKATMLSFEEAASLVGHEVGGVCPFGVNEGVAIYLDVSLREYDTVYPAAGNAGSAVRLTPDELEKILPEATWIDVCKVR